MRMSFVLVFTLVQLCRDGNAQPKLSCPLSLLAPYRQTIQLADIGDGVSERIPPQAQIKQIWPLGKETLAVESVKPTPVNKVWLYKTIEGKSYRLHQNIPNFPCIQFSEQTLLNPFKQIFHLYTRLPGTYMLAEYETSWKYLRDVESHQGKNEIYTPLATFVVVELKAAPIGISLRLTTYSAFADCTGTIEKLNWVLSSLEDLRVTRSLRRDLAMLDGTVSHEIRRIECRPLSNDSSPDYVMAYYSVDRARITPTGMVLEKEREWKRRENVTEDIEFGEYISIPLPQPFGVITRIRLQDVEVHYTDEILITLRARSEEGMTEVFWGPGNVELPFETERVLPHDWATVRINQSLFRKMCPPEKETVDWMVIEPMYGRIRTSTGVLIAMNVWDSWSSAEFLTELFIEKTGDDSTKMRIGKLTFEIPSHPLDIGEALRAAREEHPLPGARPRHTRACLTSVHGYASSSYHVNLEEPLKCIEKDREQHNVSRKMRSMRSPLISYSAQLLQDDFGDEMEDASGTLFGHIQMVSFPANVRGMRDFKLDCPKAIGEAGLTMRMGFVVDRVRDEVQYLARWEDRWVHYNGSGKHVFYQPLNETKVKRWASTPGVCPPERVTIDFVYNLETHRLRVITNDTDGVLLEYTLRKHPMWLGIEMFISEKMTLCVGCFVHIQIDRRAVHHNQKQVRWPAVETEINPWHQIYYPRQFDSKAIWNAWVDISQAFPKRIALMPSPKNLQRRLLDLVRKLANPVNFSVALIGAAAYCPPGLHMPYGTPAMCVECPPGTEASPRIQGSSFPTHICKKCPIGTYQDEVGQAKCKPCVAGQGTPELGAWSKGLCGPNVTAGGMYVATTHGISEGGSPHAHTQMASTSREQSYNWMRDDEDADGDGESDEEGEFVEGPGELNMVSTGRLVFNMVCLVLLLGCVMSFMVTSTGYMLVRLTKDSYRELTIEKETTRTETEERKGEQSEEEEEEVEEVKSERSR